MRSVISGFVHVFYDGEVRTLLVWCPDWPVVAVEITEGVPASEPVAVLRAGRVIACSEAARAARVRRGLRKREAQSRCPQLTVFDHDPGRDARAFEPVVAAVEDKAAGVEVVRPGACALAARGPTRYFGGEERAAEQIVEHVAQECGVESQAGIADGVFAAGLAARAGQLVPPGQTPRFLASQPVETLDRPELADLLRRLGVRTLGDFAGLAAGDVLARFGFDAAYAHRLAAGRDQRPLAVRKPPPDLDVVEVYDEPLDRVDVAAFAARALAERLHAGLAGHGLACTRLIIEAVTAHGQELHRVWRHDGLLTSAAIADRVRWQLDGWLTGRRGRPTAGIVRLRLTPDGVLAHVGLQPGLWGETGEERERAQRAFSRVQGILGPDALFTAVLGGGRGIADQVRFVPWGEERAPIRPGPPPPAAPAAESAAESAVESAVESEPPSVRLDESPGRSAAPRPTLVRPTATEPASPSVRPAGGGLPSARPTGPVLPSAQSAGGGLPSARPTGPVLPSAQSAGGGLPSAQSVSGGLSSARPAGGALPAAAAWPDPAPGRRGGGSGAAVPRAGPPWPGRMPPPQPVTVLPVPLPAALYDDAGEPVRLSARLEVSAAPARLAIAGRPPVAVTAWAGPWPVDERWWARGEARRRARFEVALRDGRALLLSLAGGAWTVEAIYD
ncbi:DNA polymerase Y family protein [Actinomycetes bacterium KLBMP 9797]